MLVQCLQSFILSDSTQSGALCTLRNKVVENIVEKGERNVFSETLYHLIFGRPDLLNGKEFLKKTNICLPLET